VVSPLTGASPVVHREAARMHARSFLTIANCEHAIRERLDLLESPSILSDFTTMPRLNSFKTCRGRTYSTNRASLAPLLVLDDNFARS